MDILGIPYLEEKQAGFCKQVAANYDKIADAACKDYSGLKKPLLELQGVLCDIRIGQPIKGGGIATLIRRYTLSELKQEKRKSRIIDKNPVHAQELSAILESRTFIYGNDPKCKPFWNIGKTGRVLSCKPNVQGDRKDDRVKNLRCGLQNGQVLLDLDISQAEPSIIQQVLKCEFDTDPYDLLAKAMEIDRQEAKPKMNMLAYATSAVKIIKHWPLKAQELFGPYAEALDDYKAQLWESGKQGKQRRFVDTLGGSRIHADRGQRTRKGQMLNWHIQGTVADIVNTASLEIIQREQVEGWKLLFPVHDSIYVVGKTQQPDELKQVIMEKAKSFNLDISVEVRSYVVGNFKQ